MKRFVVMPALMLVTCVNAEMSVEERACTIEGTLTLMGQSIYSKDCIELQDEADVTLLKRMCDGLAEAGKGFGGQAGEVTYSVNCPLPAQGSCVGFANQPANAYYYARSAEDLANLPASCQFSGGVWKAAN